VDRRGLRRRRSEGRAPPKAYFGGVVLGVVPGVVLAGGLTWPVVDGAVVALEPAVSPPADGGEALVAAPGVASALGVAAAFGGPAALGVASGPERTSEAAGALAAVLASAPVEATSWPDHQSLDARCFGDAFR
jgi:hypothetical protein